MTQLLGTTLILAISISTAFEAKATQARANVRPIEVKSDPYGVGNPTHYSILRGNSRVTFSHPLLGQFSRAEISVREKKGIRITRFLISPDGATYRPILHALTPYEVHYSKPDEKLCVANEPSPLQTMAAIGPKTVDAETIAKKRDELIKSNFFDPSCFEPTVEPEHRNAIFNAAADVLAVSTQNSIPEPKYLQCLETYGFAHQSGMIQALKKAATKDSKECSVKVKCSADDDPGAEPASFDEKTCAITLNKTTQPVREDYGRLIFHELTHLVPVRDGIKLRLIEECCTVGKNCPLLKAAAEQTHAGEKKTTLVERVDARNAVATSTLTVLKGTDDADRAVAQAPAAIAALEKMGFTSVNPPFACKATGKATCDSESLSAFAKVSKVINACSAKTGSVASTNSFNNVLIATLILRAEAASSEQKSVTCESEDIGFTATVLNAIKVETGNSEAKTYADLVDKLPQTSPITWDTPAAPVQEPAVPLRLAQDDEPVRRAPVRTIASIAPLPEPRAQRSLGSSKNRADVDSGRATVLVDTLEKAARKVSDTLTPEKLDSLAVDKEQIFAKDFKPKTKSPHYLVASSATKPLQVADIGDLKDLEFRNPFAGVKIKANPSSQTTDAEAAAKVEKPKAGSKSTLIANVVIEKSANSPDPKPSQEPENTRGHVANSSTAGPASTATTKTAESRNASSSANHNFKMMDRTTLVKFITSGFRGVSNELENPDFAEALVKNHIQVLDHENRRIGSMKPEMTFVYRSDLGRLVQTRVDREHK